MFKLSYKELLKLIRQEKGMGVAGRRRRDAWCCGNSVTVVENWKHSWMGKTAFLEHQHVWESGWNDTEGRRSTPERDWVPCVSTKTNLPDHVPAQLWERKSEAERKLNCIIHSVFHVVTQITHTITRLPLGFLQIDEVRLFLFHSWAPGQRTLK